ncbi:MAG: glycosyltransferase family 2 protein [Candidatus Saccharibacteria bacterium]|nr:glycosyltransferase family 2 protein [Candidatus Saccharibacteria bacterium]
MVFVIFGLSAAFELLISSTPKAWRYRRILLIPAISFLGLWTGMSYVSAGYAFWLAICFISAYRMFNLLRIAKERHPQARLYKSTRQTSYTLVTLQLGILVFIETIVSHISSVDLLVILLSSQIIAGIALLAITSWNIFETNHRKASTHLTDKQLPTVTVAIPARNETPDLSACLESILANNYPKLEILVLDDCSQDQTAAIIKDFAHDGVRFINGEEPAFGWLAKNQAYDKLLDEATGEIVVFCGVDVRFGSSAIRNLVDSFIENGRDMISVMPLRIGGGVRTSFIQPLRYWWELALPRSYKNRPPVLSTCWAVRRRVAKKLGGFQGVRQSILPEGFFAREIAKTGKYSFMRANESLNLRTVKTVEQQLQTAVRMRYPQVKQRPEFICIVTAIQAIGVVFPFLYMLSGVITGFGAYHWLALLACAVYISVHYLIMVVSNPASVAVALINFPIAVITEIYIAHLSMFRYEFSEVKWKDRNVCIPVMTAIPHLPKIPKRTG